MRGSNANENVGLPLVAGSLSPAQPTGRVTTVHSNFPRALEGESRAGATPRRFIL